MNFIYYIFDLDNCLLHFIDSEKYFYILFTETLKNFINFIPKRDEMRKAWNSLDLNHYIQKKWSIKNPDNFWLYFKTLDILKRQELIDNGNIYFDKIGLKIIRKLKKKKKKLL